MNSIETYVLQQIGESTDSPDIFTEGSEDMEFLRDSINHGIDEVCLATGCFSTTYLLTLREGRMFYRFRQTRDTYLYPLEVLDRGNNRRLQQTSLEELKLLDPWFMKSTGSSGFASHYFLVAHDVIGIYRKPTDTGRVIEIRAAALPKHYADDTELPQVRQMLERAVAHYAMSEYHASRGDARRAAEELKVFMDLSDLSRMMPSELPPPMGSNYGFSRQ